MHGEMTASSEEIKVPILKCAENEMRVRNDTTWVVLSKAN